MEAAVTASGASGRVARPITAAWGALQERCRGQESSSGSARKRRRSVAEAIWERSVAPGAAVAAPRNVAGPVPEARDVAVARAVAVAAICGVERSAPTSQAREDRGPNIIID